MMYRTIGLKMKNTKCRNVQPENSRLLLDTEYAVLKNILISIKFILNVINLGNGFSLSIKPATYLVLMASTYFAMIFFFY